jgi:hypothetical protein
MSNASVQWEKENLSQRREVAKMTGNETGKISWRLGERNGTEKTSAKGGSKLWRAQSLGFSSMEAGPGLCRLPPLFASRFRLCTWFLEAGSHVESDKTVTFIRKDDIS